ncbi:hypothetical protein BACFRA24663_12000 [Bacteroides fragilis]
MDAKYGAKIDTILIIPKSFTCFFAHLYQFFFIQIPDCLKMDQKIHLNRIYYRWRIKS